MDKDKMDYSVRKPQKRINYADSTVEYTPQEKYNCYEINENVNTSKEIEISDETISIGTPSPKGTKASSDQKAKSPQEIQSHNVSSSSEEDTRNDDLEIELLTIKQVADKKIIELKAKGAVEKSKIDGNLKKIDENRKKIDENLKKIDENLKKIDENVKEIEENTKMDILEIEEQRQTNIIRSAENYQVEKAKILSRKKPRNK